MGRSGTVKRVLKDARSAEPINFELGWSGLKYGLVRFRTGPGLTHGNTMYIVDAFPKWGTLVLKWKNMSGYFNFPWHFSKV